MIVKDQVSLIFPFRKERLLKTTQVQEWGQLRYLDKRITTLHGMPNKNEEYNTSSMECIERTTIPFLK